MIFDSNCVQAICGNAPEWLVKAFNNKNVNLISVGTTDALSGPTAHHIDMMALKFKDKTVFTTPETKFINFSSFGYTSAITSKAHLKPIYPDEVLLNCAVIGNNLICNTKYTATEILDYAELHNMNIINVKQGYANCSICQVGDNAFITEDESIYKVLSKALKGLLIKKGEVNLPGYDYGFIGGATAFYNDTVYFFGNISNHTDYNCIKSFIENNGFNICELSNKEPLTDIGGVIFI